jgi:hypothetical protein
MINTLDSLLIISVFVLVLMYSHDHHKLNKRLLEINNNIKKLFTSQQLESKKSNTNNTNNPNTN